MITCTNCRTRRAAHLPADDPYLGGLTILANGKVDSRIFDGNPDRIYPDNAHHTVEGVRRCHNGTGFPCGWLMDSTDDEGGMIVVSCQAIAWDTGTGFECEAGHSHVNAETRAAEGWDYASDRDEAEALAKAGVEPYEMSGRVWMF
jgi:hypothetical protein